MDIIAEIEKRDEFILLEDGYLYWWPAQMGAVDADTLRVIADELDKRNKSWDEVVQKGT